MKQLEVHDFNMSLKGKLMASNGKSVQSDSYNRKTGTKTRAIKRPKFSSSEDDSDVEGNTRKSGKCQTRNAIIARMNRIKKKNYITNIENDLAHYKAECENMRGTLSMQSTMIQTLRNEVRYLKNVLANSKEISVLVKTVRDSTGLPTISSLKPVVKVEPRLNMTDICSNGDVDLSSAALPLEDDDCLLPSSGSDLDISDLLGDLNGVTNSDDILGTSDLTCNVGICLHIAQQRVSLEFCSLCNSKSSSAWENLAA
ncbi:hypothetical protein B566_EDAN005495 [Ephemera danica]|nr:hypothetical protein B566_EDAN005495 [Ephemera danica]